MSIDERIDAGFCVEISKSTLDLRIKVNKAVGLDFTGMTEDEIPFALWSIRKDILSGKTENEVFEEDKERLNRAKERAENRGNETTCNEKKFVNAFGEATNRDISTASYRNAIRRQEKAIMRYIGLK